MPNLKHEKLLKTLGPQSSRLILNLYEQKHPIFRLNEAQRILGGERNAVQQLVFDLVKKGIVTRLKPGLFRLVPFELGFEREYLGNPYIVARELTLARRKKTRSKKVQPYFLSHASAFDLHQISTQPQLVVYVSTPYLIRPRTILGTEFRFVRSKPKHLFGITEIWLDKNEKVQVSDLERTLLDGLKQPSYCGGLTEVAKGFWIKRDSLNFKRLVDYALRLDIGAVIRRLGFLMELYEMNAAKEIERLHSKLTATYQLLDPELPAEGKFLSRWKLRLNISEEELQHAVRT